MHSNPRWWYELNNGRSFALTTPWYHHAGSQEEHEPFLLVDVMNDGKPVLIEFTNGEVSFAWDDGNTPEKDNFPEYYRGENYEAVQTYLYLLFSQGVPGNK